MSTIIRPVCKSDHASWAALFRKYREFYNLVPNESVVDTVWGWIHDPQHPVDGLLAERDGQILGIAHVRVFARPSTGSTGLWLDDLYVHSGFRGDGVGRALIRQIVEGAEAEGLSVVRWITASDNVTAQRLYDAVARRTAWVTYDARTQ